MTDYKRAVELAEGWSCGEYAGSELAYLDTINGACWRGHDDEEWALDELPQIILDALRCQLVRQVDATEWKVHVYRDRTIICSKADEEYTIHKGDDRTDNTLNAIVDSRILEK